MTGVLIASAHGAGRSRCRKNAAPPRKVTRTQLWTFDGPGFSRRAWIEESEENTRLTKGQLGLPGFLAETSASASATSSVVGGVRF